jgi:tRNA (guanine-N7-)-methyltransferase
MRMRRKKHGDRRIAACGDLLIGDPARIAGTWLEQYGQIPAGAPCKKLHVELGCGKGGFVTEMARRHPDTLFVAIEKNRDVLLLAMERTKRENLPNVRFILEDIGGIQAFFADGEVDRFYLNFSDPWRKTRQHKRRLTNPDLLRRYKSQLAPQGEIHLKTDNAELFDYSLRHLEQTGFHLQAVTRDLHGSTTPDKIAETEVDSPITEYEALFIRQGVPVCRLEARLTETIAHL